MSWSSALSSFPFVVKVLRFTPKVLIKQLSFYKPTFEFFFPFFSNLLLLWNGWICFFLSNLPFLWNGWTIVKSFSCLLHPFFESLFSFWTPFSSKMNGIHPPTSNRVYVWLTFVINFGFFIIPTLFQCLKLQKI